MLRSRYVKAVEDFKKAKVNDEKSLNQKHKMIEIVEDTKQKRAVESSIKSLGLNIKSYSIAAEEKSDLSFLAKANSFLHILRKKKEF